MIYIIISMIIWGSIGLFIRWINMSSIEIAFLRAGIAACFLLFYSFFYKKIDMKKIKENIILLILAGAAVAFNWIMLFQAYRFTSIATATICYYFAPVIVVLLSPFVLKEKMTLVKIFSIFLSMTGLFIMMYYSPENVGRGSNNLLGILFGLLAAVFYALVVVLTKKMKDIESFEITCIEIFVAALVLLPFVLYHPQLHIKNIQTGIIVCILGLIHTGLAYILYFKGIRQVKAQNAALLSYIDPLSAICFSTVFLGEIPNKAQVIGALFIFMASFIHEIKIKNPQIKQKA